MTAFPNGLGETFGHVRVIETNTVVEEAGSATPWTYEAPLEYEIVPSKHHASFSRLVAERSDMNPYVEP